MKKWALLVLIPVILIAADWHRGRVTTAAQVEPEKTQLQVREFQSRIYDTGDIKMVMKTMINVLQDDGFIVRNAEKDLGLLSAEKSDTVRKRVYITECSANVSEYGKKTRVRINFLLKIMNRRGGIYKIGEIEDPEYYQDFFLKVDKGLFIQNEKL
ncbi:MAG: hypothetical protein HZA11_07390 [Nitrospirae bacterium]|nr:hypothetical protein [Nitrospirota bacterium]